MNNQLSLHEMYTTFHMKSSISQNGYRVPIYPFKYDAADIIIIIIVVN